MNQSIDAQAITRLRYIASAKFMDGRIGRAAFLFICRNCVDDSLRACNSHVHRMFVPHVCRYTRRATQTFDAGIEDNPPRVTSGDANCRTFIEEPLDNATAEETSASEDSHQCHIKSLLALRGLSSPV